MPVQVTILTPGRCLLDHQECRQVELPGSGGAFGVLEDHTPLVAALAVGQILLLDAQGSPTHHVAVTEGMAGVAADHVLVTAHAAERAEEIDLQRAQAARKRAERRLHHPRDINIERAELALARALNRIRVARSHDKS
ncbi:MAG: ATP synthase F1 subunit epsilon [Anaerolineaceae bacterium]|nr:ATP synthase F1 subunit epsilon [Anaerolineaceae bacterium]